jgi:hypothetical protein
LSLAPDGSTGQPRHSSAPSKPAPDHPAAEKGQTSVEAVETDLQQPVTRGLYDLTSGRLPRAIRMFATAKETAEATASASPCHEAGIQMTPGIQRFTRRQYSR